MSTPHEPTSEPSASVRLRVERSARVDLNDARLALGDLSWLGRVTIEQADEPAVRRIATDLELAILDGSASGPVRKAALIDLGLPQSLEDGALTLTVAWRSATAAPLFPLFAGELQVASDRLVLDGRYVPPFGRFGLVIDVALLHVVARRTAHAFLARVAAQIGR